MSDDDCNSEEQGVENIAEVEFTAETVNVCQVLFSQIDSEVTRAKQLELQNWVKENVYDEVIDQGQRHISVHWVVTSKLDNGIWKTKVRLIARGFEETKNNFRTDSPTCLKESFRVALTIASSKCLTVNSIDIKAAFLQGKPIDRKVFLKPPKEAGANGKLWQLKKVVYGLTNASQVWYLRVVDELNKLNAKVDTL